MKNKRVAIVGGCGHVGLPLGISLATKGFEVDLLDINETSVKNINAGILPFVEGDDAENKLKTAVANKQLRATTNKAVLSSVDTVVFVTGTPVDEHLNPRIQDVTRVVGMYIEQLKPEQLIVLRSTVYPGTVELVDNLLSEKLKSHMLAYCPERIAQGYGLKEIEHLPQLISGTSPAAVTRAKEMFSQVAKKTIELKPQEAELAKLITNSWRYIEFAIANQFYMMTEAAGLDFQRIFGAIREDYPRAAHFARPGFAAGPCLFKDTMQLSAFHKGNFFLGHSSMLINEGLPVFLAEQMEKKLGSLKKKKIAILGMTFKADNDDIRDSLSFKLKKVLEMKMANVLPTDPFLPEFPSLENALEEADGVILGTPHTQYRKLKIEKPTIDCWGVWK